MIVIVDYGLGNLGSVKNMISKIGFESLISDRPDDISRASKLILPGVGSFDKGVSRLHDLGLFDVISHRVSSNKIPILGICLGMQLLTRGSEEGKLSGFGFFDADAVKFKFKQDEALKIPHMGWNTVQIEKESRLFRANGVYKFYFVHSYAVKCDDRSDILTSSRYGSEFASSISKENIFGVQFHPEKSHIYGKELLGNFCEL